MSNHRGHAVAKARHALFSSVDRIKLLDQAIGEPTGEIVTIGGLEFNLVPLSTSEALEIIDLIERYGALIGQIREGGGAIDEAELSKIIHAEGGRILNLMRRVLYDAVLFENAEQEQLFDEWFQKIPIIESLRKLVPAVMRANALKKLAGNESPATPEAETSPEPPLSSETLSATS